MISSIKNSLFSNIEESNIIMSTQTTSIHISSNKLTSFLSSKNNALRAIELDDIEEPTSSFLYPGRINRKFRKTSKNVIENIPHLDLD